MAAFVSMPHFPYELSIAQLIKIFALAAGMDPTDYSGHSLRAGLATVLRQGR